MLHGWGKLTMNGDRVYEGEFRANLKHGKGIQRYTRTGDYYEGDWKENKMTGKGKFCFASSKKEYEGDFVEGQFYGVGVMKCDEFCYSGFFRSNLFEGYGKY